MLFQFQFCCKEKTKILRNNPGSILVLAALAGIGYAAHVTALEYVGVALFLVILVGISGYVLWRNSTEEQRFTDEMHRR